jgi:hypothetical protein
LKSKKILRNNISTPESTQLPRFRCDAHYLLYCLKGLNANHQTPKNLKEGKQEESIDILLSAGFSAVIIALVEPAILLVISITTKDDGHGAHGGLGALAGALEIY